MTFEISLRLVINAEKEFVFDWWTDLSPDDTKLMKPLKSRTIVSRSPNEIRLHDEEVMYFHRMEFDVRVTLQRPTRWVAEYDGNSARARSEYILSTSSENPAKTILDYRTKIEPKGFFTILFSFLVKPFVERVFLGEMLAFKRELESEYRSKMLTLG